MEGDGTKVVAAYHEGFRAFVDGHQRNPYDGCVSNKLDIPCNRSWQHGFEDADRQARTAAMVHPGKGR